MAGPEFFQTGMGRAFYEGTVPALVRELKKLNDNLKNTNEIARYGSQESDRADPLKPTGRDPEKFREFLTTVIAEAENSGEAAGRMIGEHLDDMHNEDPNVIIAELQNIEEWAASIRKKLL